MTGQIFFVKSFLTLKENLEKVHEIVKNNFFKGISSLSDYICEKFGLKHLNGKNQRSTVNKALRKLNDQGKLELPWQKIDRKHNVRELKERIKPCRKPNENEDAKINAVFVSKDDESNVIYNTFLRDEVSGEKRVIIGYKMRYVIKSGDEIVGILGFSSPDSKSRYRDSALGLKKDQRDKCLKYCLNLRHIFMRKGWESYLGQSYSLENRKIRNC